MIYRKRQIGVWRQLEPGYKAITQSIPSSNAATMSIISALWAPAIISSKCAWTRCDRVWFMLHSGSRGVGNRIGMFFIDMARRDMREHIKNLPDRDLAYFEEGSEHFDDYVDAVGWAQEFALYNRKLMMEQLIDAVTRSAEFRPFALTETAINCHHNYVAREEHYGQSVFVTRKGAVRAGKGDIGIIPGSMGARSYIVRGRGNPESFY